MKPKTNSKGRHRDNPAKAQRVQNGKLWEMIKSQAQGRSAKLSPEKLTSAINQFRNSRPNKPNTKKPLNRPK